MGDLALGVWTSLGRVTQFDQSEQLLDKRSKQVSTSCKIITKMLQIGDKDDDKCVTKNCVCIISLSARLLRGTGTR